MSKLELFATCAPGLEPLLQEELRALGASPKAQPGGCRFFGDAALMMRVNLESGLALRVLWRVARFYANHLAQLEKRAQELDWPAWLAQGARLELKVHSRKSRLYHTGAIEQRLLAAARRRLGEPTDEEPILVQARFQNDECELSIDTSGAPLHKRGWREETAKAPLREDLARALLLTSGWRPEEPLIDPMAGAGTLLIEAATMARKLPCGWMRDFAFFRAPDHDPALFERLKAERLAQALPKGPAPLYGGDRDAGALRIITENARRAGVLEDLALQRAPISGFKLPELAQRAALVCNPPYGKRIGGPAQLRNLYAALGNKLREAQAPLRIALYSTSPALVQATGLALKSAFMTDHGGLKIRAFVGELLPFDE